MYVASSLELYAHTRLWLQVPFRPDSGRHGMWHQTCLGVTPIHLTLRASAP